MVWQLFNQAVRGPSGAQQQRPNSEVGGVSLETSSRLFGSERLIAGLNLLVYDICVNNRGVWFHRIRDFKQNYFQQYSANLSLTAYAAVLVLSCFWTTRLLSRGRARPCQAAELVHAPASELVHARRRCDAVLPHDLNSIIICSIIIIIIIISSSGSSSSSSLFIIVMIIISIIIIIIIISSSSIMTSKASGRRPRAGGGAEPFLTFLYYY